MIDENPEKKFGEQPPMDSKEFLHNVRMYCDKYNKNFGTTLLSILAKSGADIAEENDKLRDLMRRAVIAIDQHAKDYGIQGDLVVIGMQMKEFLSKEKK